MKTVFVTIQFIDSHSESIRHKNLLEIDGKPLWMYNAEAAKALCRPTLEERNTFPGGENYWLKDYWICTTYNDETIPLEYGRKIPRYAINVGKCQLGDRVAGAVNHLNANCETKADAYVLLLGNVFSRDPKSLILRACDTWCNMKKLTPELTGLLSVANYPMFGPGRALSLKYGLFARNVFPIDTRYGEEKQDEVSNSWFFDGGVMVMDAKNKLIDNTAIVISDTTPSNWENCGKFSTQFQYLGDCVATLRQNPLDSVEIDSIWQLMLLSASAKREMFEILRAHADSVLDK